MNQESGATELQKLSFLMGLTERLQTSRNIQEIGYFALDYLVQIMGCAFGDIKTIQELEGDRQASSLSYHASATFASVCGEPALAAMESALSQGIPSGTGIIWQVVETGEPLFIDDYANHPNAVPAFRHPLVGQLGIFPIPNREGTVIGLLTLESRTNRNLPENLQADLILAACRTIGAWLERAKSQEKLRSLNQTLEAQVQQRTAELEAANAELESFSYSVAHDLRAPIRHVDGFIRALRIKLERGATINDPEVTDYLSTIDTSSKKMAQLVDALLTLSRLSRRELNPQIVNLETLAQTAIASVKFQIAAEERTVEWNLGELPTVQGDPILLQQIFNNLIGNAVKYSRDSSPTQIAIGSLPDGSGTVFIRDNGAGFNMAYYDQLFEPFQRLHSQKEFSGTGIGLAIVQRIIQRHHGKIWAESQLGKGTVFYFRLGTT